MRRVKKCAVVHSCRVEINGLFHQIRRLHEGGLPFLTIAQGNINSARSRESPAQQTQVVGVDSAPLAFLFFDQGFEMSLGSPAISGASAIRLGPNPARTRALPARVTAISSR